jgi:hypothetical protein
MNAIRSKINIRYIYAGTQGKFTLTLPILYFSRMDELEMYFDGR